MKIHEPDVARLLVEEIGLDPGLVDEAIADETTNDEVKADHDKVIAAGGFGMPTLPRWRWSVGTGYLRSGTDRPADGRGGLRLWDMVCGWLEFPTSTNSSARRPTRTSASSAVRSSPTWRPRDWVSINRGKVAAIEEDGFKVKGDAKDAGKLKS